MAAGGLGSAAQDLGASGLEDVPKPPQAAVSLGGEPLEGTTREMAQESPGGTAECRHSPPRPHPWGAGLKTPGAHFWLCSHDAVMMGYWANLETPGVSSVWLVEPVETHRLA